MKKFLSVVLVIALVLSTVCFAETENKKYRLIYNDELSFDVVYVPGYHTNTAVLDDTFVISMTPEENAALPEIAIIVVPDEEYAGMKLNDLSDEELAIYAASLNEDFHDMKWEIKETTLGTKVIVANENDGSCDYGELVTLYDGYAFSVYMEHTDGNVITDAEIDVVMQFLSDMDLIYNERNPQ